MLALCLPFWQTALAQQNAFDGERVVHLPDEPRHRPVRQHGQLYLLDGPGLFHIMALVHDGSGKLISDSDEPGGMEIAPEIENAWFRSYRYELAPGETAAMQHHINPSFVILGSEGTVRVSREDGLARELAYAGEWAWREPGSACQIANVGDSAVAIIVNEGRQQH